MTVKVDQGRTVVAPPTLTLRVEHVEAATPRYCLLRLGLNGQAFPYRAGQAVRVRPHGGGTSAVYSMASAPSDAHGTGQLELLVRVDRTRVDVPAFPLAAGTLLDVEGPLGAFGLPRSMPERQRLVFIAGGSGIAPIRAMVRDVLPDPRVFVTLLYSARSADEFAFQRELHDLSASGRIALIQTITRSDEWVPSTAGANGRIGVAHLSPLADSSSTQYYVCGPLDLVRSTDETLRALGVPESHIHQDRW